MSYLGFNVAVPLTVAAATGPLAPFAAAADLVTSGAQLLPAIGAGRKEADAIGPEQRKLGDALTDVDTLLRTQTLTGPDLQQMRNQLSALWQTFLNFIYQDAFTRDGDTRASDQARATMEPQVNMRLNTLDQLIGQVLGKPNPPQLVQSGIPNLEFRTTSDLSLPQAGYLQPGSSTPQPQPVVAPAPGIDTDLLVKIGLAAGLVFFISRR